MSQRTIRARRTSQQHQQTENDYEMPGTSQQSQPRRSRNTRASQVADLDGDEDNDPFALSQSSQKSRAPDLTQIQLNNLVGHLIKCILLADQSKIPIQRTHLIKKALPNHGKYFRHIIGKVQNTLKEVFGYNLVELDGAKYILTNNLNIQDKDFQSSKLKKSDMVLLFILLSHIFMCSEQTCSEKELFELLTRMQIMGDDPVHEYFGDARQLITGKFVDQRYLHIENVDKSDPPVRQCKWGVRAEHELSPRSVLEFVSKIFNNQPMSSWPEQFRIVEQLENS